MPADPPTTASVRLETSQLAASPAVMGGGRRSGGVEIADGLWREGPAPRCRAERRVELRVLTAIDRWARRYRTGS